MRIYVRNRQFRLRTKWFSFSLDCCLRHTYINASSILRKDPYAREGRPFFCRIDVGRLIVYIMSRVHVCICVYMYAYVCHVYA